LAGCGSVVSDGVFVGETVMEAAAPKWHQAALNDRLSTATAPLETSKNAGNYKDFCVDIVEVTDSSSVPPTKENTG
jgi:hypothetical protein